MHVCLRVLVLLHRISKRGWILIDPGNEIGLDRVAFKS